MSEAVNYQEIHAYMLEKTREYYQCPPAALVEAAMERCRKNGLQPTYEEAAKLVTPIEIQRLVKEEMRKKWPEFMASIPSNPLQGRD